MHCVAFDTVVGILDACVGIMDGSHANLMSACEAQASTKAVLELKRRAQVVVFHFGILERCDADARFEIRRH